MARPGKDQQPGARRGADWRQHPRTPSETCTGELGGRGFAPLLAPGRGALRASWLTAAQPGSDWSSAAHRSPPRRASGQAKCGARGAMRPPRPPGPRCRRKHICQVRPAQGTAWRTLSNHAAPAQSHRRLGVGRRDRRILDLEAAQVAFTRLDGERCVVAVLDANAQRQAGFG